MPDGQTDSLSVKGYGCASVPAGTDPPASPSPGGASIYEFDRSGGGGALHAQRRLRARRYPLFRTRTLGQTLADLLVEIGDGLFQAFFCHQLLFVKLLTRT